MIYLYLKTHNKTGLKYLGKTSAKDPNKYTGSGVYWLRHLKIHGIDVKTEILFESSCAKEIKEKGLYFSKLWNVATSKDFANLKIEEGEGGFSHIFSNKENYMSSWTKRGEKLGGENKGKIVVRDLLGDIFQVDLLDPRYLSKELIPHTKGFVTLYDQKGDKIRVTKGTKNQNLKSNNKEKIYITNGINRKMISKNTQIPEGWYLGDNRVNPNTNKIWINDGVSSKMIVSDSKIPENWKRGRLLKSSLNNF